MDVAVKPGEKAESRRRASDGDQEGRRHRCRFRWDRHRACGGAGAGSMFLIHDINPEAIDRALGLIAEEHAAPGVKRASSAARR